MKLQQLILLVLLPVFLFAENQVTISADPWCPFNCEDSAEQKGFMIELGEAALESYGLQMNYKNINWARTKKLVQNGQVDAIVGIGRSDRVKNQYVYPKTALGVEQICFFTRATNDWSFENESSIQGQRFGWITDFEYGHAQFLQDWIQTKKQEQSDQLIAVSGDSGIYSRLFKLMMANRIDLIADDLAVIQHSLKEHGLLNDIKMAGCVHGSISPVYIAFSKEIKNGQIYADALDFGISKMIENGDAQKVLARYGLKVEDMIRIRAE